MTHSRSFSQLSISLALALAWLSGCAISPLGRHQLLMMPEAEIERIGVAAYDQMKVQLRRSRDPRAIRYVHCVAIAVTKALSGRAGRQKWEVTIFDDPAANAFALPGGKIGVQTGMLDVAGNQHQLAAVIGHEIAHVLANHANERLSAATVAQTSVQLVQALSNTSSPAQRELLGQLGVGVAQVGILLPFNRAQETEADLIGLDLMARAGFDPRESVALWENMRDAGNRQPAEFLSTHPANATRIAALRQRMPSAIELANYASRQGVRPRCD